jgi:CubicO group peptidase (beta-lactamase class C family)
MKGKSNHSLLKVILFGLLIQIFTIQINYAQNKAAEIDKLMSLYSEYDQFIGTVLVAEHGKIIYKKGFGMANKEWDILNQPNTKLRLGSITKQFTAMLILQLVEEGKLKLEVPITTYLPDYPKVNGNKITIHNLLTHSSGIPNYTDSPDFMKDKSRDHFEPEAFIKTFADLPLEFNPGQKFDYSNSGYFVLGYIIEKVTGKSYEKCLEERIFKPLNMLNSGFDHADTILKNRATGYEKNGSTYVNSNFIDMSLPYSAGSLYSTVEDLYLWDQALYTEKLLSSKSRELLFFPHITTGASNYGYGWGVFELPLENSTEKLKIVEHTGGINGFRTIISRALNDKNLIVLLSNSGTSELNPISKAIRAILYNKPYKMPKKSLADALLATYNDKGIDAGAKMYEELKDSNDYVYEEDDMNATGYQLLQSGKVKEAIAIFKLNITKFPESGNVYDSLGEAYLANGDKELALVNYKKSVALDPANENGKKIIEELQKK